MSNGQATPGRAGTVATSVPYHAARGEASGAVRGLHGGWPGMTSCPPRPATRVDRPLKGTVDLLGGGAVADLAEQHAARDRQDTVVTGGAERGGVKRPWSDATTNRSGNTTISPWSPPSSSIAAWKGRVELVIGPRSPGVVCFGLDPTGRRRRMIVGGRVVLEGPAAPARRRCHDGRFRVGWLPRHGGYGHEVWPSGNAAASGSGWPAGSAATSSNGRQRCRAGTARPIAAASMLVAPAASRTTSGSTACTTRPPMANDTGRNRNDPNSTTAVIRPSRRSGTLRCRLVTHSSSARCWLAPKASPSRAAAAMPRTSPKLSVA